MIYRVGHNISWRPQILALFNIERLKFKPTILCMDINCVDRGKVLKENGQ